MKYGPCFLFFLLCFFLSDRISYYKKGENNDR